MHGNSDQTNSQKKKRKMPKAKLSSKKVVNHHFSSIPCIPSFGNNISDIIYKFENSPKSLSPIVPIELKHVTRSKHINTDCSESKFSTEKSKNVINSTFNKEKNKFSQGKRYCKQSACKMYESNKSDLSDGSDHEQCDNNDNETLTNYNDTIENDDVYDIIDTSINLNNYEFEQMNDDTATATKFQRLKNINLIKCQLNLFQRIVGIVLSFPFFSSINGAGLTTLSCAFFLPRILCENILYPIFRLTLGTLYPAYASYKAVRNKDVKDYVSNISSHWL